MSEVDLSNIPAAGAGLDMSFLATLAAQGSDDRDIPQSSKGSRPPQFTQPPMGQQSGFQQQQSFPQQQGMTDAPPRMALQQSSAIQEGPPPPPNSQARKTANSQLSPIDREDLSLEALQVRQQRMWEEQQQLRQYQRQQPQQPQSQEEQPLMIREDASSFWEKYQASAMWASFILLFVIVVWAYYRSQQPRRI